MPRFDYVVRGTPSVPTRLVIDAVAGTTPSPSWFNLRDFPNLQAAHDALPAYGGEIFVPAGKYSIDDPGVLISKPNVTIRGEGLGSILQPSSQDPSYNLITVLPLAQENNHFRMCDVVVDGLASGGGVGSCLVLSGTSNVDPRLQLDGFLKNVVLRNAGWHGLVLTSVSRFFALNCAFDSNQVHGVKISGGAVSRLIGCSMSQNGAKGIDMIQRVNLFLAMNCRFKGNRGGGLIGVANGIDVHLANPDATSNTGRPRINILGCTFEDALTATRAEQFIRLDNALGALIDGCVFGGETESQQPKRGVYVTGLSSATRVSNCRGWNLALRLAEFTSGITGVEFGNVELPPPAPPAPQVVGPARIASDPGGLFSVRSAGQGKAMAVIYSYNTPPPASQVPPGSMVWVTTTRKLCVSDGSAWKDYSTSEV